MNNQGYASDLYTSLEEAKEEIWRRWNNENLRKEVEIYVKIVPEFMRKEPLAILWRNLASPNMDYHNFLKLTEQVKLTPVVFEYLQDKFVTINRDKLALAKMAFYHGKNKKGERIINCRNVVAFNEFDGKRIAEVKTLWGESFIDFHHRLINRHSPKKVDIVDNSVWFQEHGGKPIGYYKYELALFICNGILFEDFLTDAKEVHFTQSVVLPAIERLKYHFGVKPLIVPISDSPADKYCWCYPANIEDEIKECLTRNNGRNVINEQCAK
ncbi:MAG: hypothetical protein HQK96_15445 [Nitrospirae bacterium]|nr:hypothetical protein [Nitrospirota bacterium]